MAEKSQGMDADDGVSAVEYARRAAAAHEPAWKEKYGDLPLGEDPSNARDGEAIASTEETLRTLLEEVSAIAAKLPKAGEKRGPGRPPGAKNKQPPKSERDFTRLMAILYGAHPELLKCSDGNFAVALPPTEDRPYRLTLGIIDEELSRWLRYEYAQRYQGAPEKKSLVQLIETMVAIIDRDGKKVKTEVRIGMGEDTKKLYVNMGNDEHEIIVLEPDGPRKLKADEECPVYFRRPHSMEPLVEPDFSAHGAEHIACLFPFAPGSKESMYCIASCLAAFLPDNADCPHTVFDGASGTMKTTLMNAIKSTVDPENGAALVPKSSTYDICIAATNSQLLFMDNVGKLSDEQSDVLCKLSTGLGFRTRMLYFTSQEITFNIKRSMLINSINHVIVAPDLVSRCMFITAPRVDEGYHTNWRTDKRIAATRAKALGAIMNAVCGGLKDYRDIEYQMTKLPRMSSFVAWMEACSPSLGWAPGQFLALFQNNITDAMLESLTSNPLGNAILYALDSTDAEEWLKIEGSDQLMPVYPRQSMRVGLYAGTLLALLLRVAPSVMRFDPSFPRGAEALSHAVRRLAPAFEHCKIAVDFMANDGVGVKIVIYRRDSEATM